MARPAARVGVVGAADWAEDVAAIAPAWQREVVAVIDPAGIEDTEFVLADVDELVVSGTAYRTVADHMPYTERTRIATIVEHDDRLDEMFAPALSRRARAVKRILDVGLGSVALVLTAPVVVAAMIAVRVESPGPALFRQHRPGLNGRSFCLLKLRTMRVDNDDGEHRAYVASLIDGTGERQGGLFKLTDDPRVTRVGRVLRRYSIDELPQLINVVRGEMSLVGPRPPVAGRGRSLRRRALAAAARQARDDRRLAGRRPQRAARTPRWWRSTSTTGGAGRCGRSSASCCGRCRVLSPVRHAPRREEA